MTRAPLRSGVAALCTILVFVLVIVAFGPASKTGSGQQAAAGKVRPGQPIPMPVHLVGLEIRLGVKDKEPRAWDGEIQVSPGRVLDVAIKGGGADAKVDGSRFEARSIMQKTAKAKTVTGPVLRASLEAPPEAKVTITTKQGKIEVAVADLAGGKAKTFLDEHASVERHVGSVRLTGRGTEDDYPALARAADGGLWLAYVEYVPGKQPLTERVTAGNFDLLVPSGNGDQLLLSRYDGKGWWPAVELSGAGLNIWRPTVVAAGNTVVVAWSQQVEGDWEIFYVSGTLGEDGVTAKWTQPIRLTKSPGSDYHVVAAADSTGTIWLAWQAWRKDNFEIMLAALKDKHPYAEPKVISTTKANDWSPSIAADSKGNVYVAWDTYDKGNYDVTLYRAGNAPQTWTVAGSARFEARPSIVCDAKDRVWIAYEEGDEQWGKDYSTNEFKKIGFDKNAGNALYINRTVKVKCLSEGKLRQPAGDLEKAFTETKLLRNKSLPRLAVDAAGGVWLTFRQHPLPTGGGEVWNSYFLRYAGKSWSEPRRLPASANLLDNRPGLAPFKDGLMTVYSGDDRLNTIRRGETELYATLLTASGSTAPPELVDDEPTPAAKVPVVHPDESADVARLRNYRIEAGGKKLRLVRGEFHRHTEYTAHRDGDGLLEDSWRYALDPGNMDWMGNGDHDNGQHHEYMWWQIQKTAELMHNPPHFIAAHTYERSVVYPDGHRNVIFPKRGIRPLPRGSLKGTAEKGTPDTKILYAYLKHFGAICAVHTSGTSMGTDWRDNDPVVEPIVEIYQGHRHNYEHFGAPRSATKETQIGGYQPAGFIWNAFEKGHRFGFQASSDHVSTHLSYAVPIVEEVSRQGMIDAFKKRHTYAATDNILVEVRSGEQLQGDAFESKQRPTLEINVIGTGPIAKLHVIRDNKYVYSTEPKQKEVKLKYTDMDAKAGGTSYYYVRVEQGDGNLAWASPMWITYRP